MIQFDLINGVVIELDLVDDVVIELDLVDDVIIQTDLINGVIIQTDLIEGPTLEFDIMTGGVGPQGPQGPPASEFITMTAGENMSAGRVVVVDTDLVFYFQPGNLNHAGRAFGITSSSAIFGNDIIVQISGLITDASFTFSNDKILWVSSDGEIFDTIPLLPVLQKAGISIEPNKLKIDFTIQIITV